MNSYSIIKHGKVVHTFKAATQLKAEQAAMIRFPKKTFTLRDNGPVVKVAKTAQGWQVAETAVSDEDHIPAESFCPDCGYLVENCQCEPECRYCGRATSQCDHPPLTEMPIPTPHYTRKLTKAQVRAEIKQKGWRGVVVACKMNPNSPWVAQHPITFTSVEEFDKFVNNFEVYNCTNETGKYAAYYSAN